MKLPEGERYDCSVKFKMTLIINIYKVWIFINSELFYWVIIPPFPEDSMFDVILKHLLSLAISLATLYVPQEKWQRKMETQPTQAERIAQKNLKGWEFKTVISSHTGLIHTFYYYPCSDTASGKTLLLLHGFNTDGSIYFNLSPLSTTHTLIAYNFPEKTDFYTGSIRDFELIVDDFCNVMHLDSVDLLGNSLGGIIAQFYTAHTGQVTINNLMLVSTYVHGATKDNVMQIQGMADKLLPFPDYKLFYLLSIGSKASGRLEKKDREDSPLESVVIKQVAWYREVLKSMYWYDGTVDTKRITCPVLVLHGKTDRLVPVEETASTGKYLPQARIRVFEKAGHTLIFSQAEEAIKAIKNLLNGERQGI